MGWLSDLGTAGGAVTGNPALGVTASGIDSGIGALQKMFGQWEDPEQERLKKLEQYNQNAYDDYLGRNKAAESQFMGETSEDNPMLQQVQSDIQKSDEKVLAGEQSKMKANLAQQGVRGGQASTLLNRGVGEASVYAGANRNKMVYDDYAKRQQQRANFLTQKGAVNIQPRYIGGK